VTYSSAYRAEQWGRDQHLEAGGLGGLVLMEPPRIVGITRDSVHPNTQDLDAQASPNEWITEIRDYLKDNILLDEHVSVEWIVRVAKRYMLVEGYLYWHGTNGILMRCITQEDDCELLTEIHGGECGNHASYRMLIGKAFWHDFYCPTALQDSVKLVKSCRACQFHAKHIHTPTQMLQMIPLSWSFAVWGLDQQAICSQFYQVNHLEVWGLEHDHH
jgi:hypothetical protein